MNTSRTKQLRILLDRPSIIRSFAAHDVFTARLMQAAGIELVFLGGFGASASMLGLPDVGLITLSEMSDAVRRMAQNLEIPVIADGDTGHGDLQNVERTVREFEQAGAAGILLEDQVSPKRCGHFAGKQVIEIDEMILKLKVALAARRDPDFIIIARTDVRAVEGLDAAIDRANRYGDVGADVCFLEAPETRDELVRVAREVKFPLLANMLVGGVTPILSADELEELGYRIVVDPIGSLQITGFAVRKLIEAMQTEGRTDGLANEMLTFAEIKDVLGLGQFLDIRDRFKQTGP